MSPKLWVDPMSRLRRAAWAGLLVAAALSAQAPAQVSYYNAYVNARGRSPFQRQTAVASTGSTPPTRFVGWKHGQTAGEQYLQRFARHRARTAIAQPASGLPSSSLTSFGATSSVALPGLALRPSLPAGFIPTSVAAGDFNRDGKMDWVVANGGDNNLWLYLGRGDGTAQLPTIIPLTGQAPVWITTVDLRGNGILDLIVADADSQTVGVLLGNGDGTFGAEQVYVMPAPPIFVATGDFNHDGHIDIVVGMDGGSAILTVLPGSGSGTFGSPIPTSAPGGGGFTVAWLSVGDLNNDGIPDVVIQASGYIVAYTSNGNGTFTESGEVTASIGGRFFMATAVGDLDEDGCADVVVTDNLGLAWTFHGSCDGKFTPGSTFSLGDVPAAAALVDINGDGHLDLVASGLDVAASYSSYGDDAENLICVLRGDGKGNLAQAQVFRGEPSMVDFSVADLNGDGHPDVVTADQETDSATVFLNDGTGGFGQPRGYSLGYNGGLANPAFSGLLQPDLNGDGRPDVVMLEQPNGSPGNYNLTTMLNTGNGNYGSLARYDLFSDSYYPGDFVLADFRGVHRPDVVATGWGSNMLSYTRNNGDGSFAPAVITKPTGANGIIAVGDFNGDGKLDFVAVGGGNSTNGEGLTTFLGNGDGTFRALPGVFFGGSNSLIISSVYAADFNHDGKLDVLVYLSSNVFPPSNEGVFLFLGNGDGTFHAPEQVFSNSPGLTVADVNGDGIPDLVVCGTAGLLPPYFGFPSIQVYIGGPAGFTLAQTYDPYGGWLWFPSWRGTGKAGGGWCTVADFNGDGKPDIAVFQNVAYDYHHMFVQFMLGNGDGSFTPTFDIFDFHKYNAPQFALDLTGAGRAGLVEMDSLTSSFNFVPSQPAAPLQIALVSDPVVGSKGYLQLTLDTPSPGTSVTLSASDTNISVPSSITVPAGAITQTVPITIGAGFNRNHVFAITAALNGVQAVAYGEQAASNAGLGFSTSVQYPTIGTGAGGTASDTFGISSVGGYAATVSFSCSGLPSGASCSFVVPNFALTPGGGGSIPFSVSTAEMLAQGNYPFTAAASDGVISSSTSLVLQVGPPLTARIAVTTPPTTLALGNTGQVTISVVNQGTGAATGSALQFNISGPAQIVSLSPTAGSCSSISSTSGACLLGTIAAGTGVNVSVTLQAFASGTVTFTMTGSGVGPDGNTRTSASTTSFAVADFSLSTSPKQLTVTAGQPGTFQLMVGGVNGIYYPNVNLSCTGAPGPDNCILSTSSVAAVGNGGTPVTVTIIAAATAQNRNYPFSRRRWAPLLACLLLTFAWAGPWGSRRIRNTVIVSCVLLAVTFFQSCGGGSGGATGGGGANPPPATGSTFTLTLTGISGTNAHSVTETITVN